MFLAVIYYLKENNTLLSLYSWNYSLFLLIVSIEKHFVIENI